MLPETISVVFTKAEALVLFELLARCDETKNLPIEHSSEQTMLWVLEGQLEKNINEIFSPDYKDLLEAARQEILRIRG